MSDMQRDPFEEAKEKDLDCFVADGRDLYIDIDDRDDLAVLAKVMGLLEHNGYVVEEVKRTVSKSGNTHVYLRFPNPLQNIERIALQACLGSDRTREALAVLRCMAGNPRPSVFFELKPGQKPTKRKKR